MSGFAPPGDIHRVRNAGDGTAISIHVYGTDVSRIGMSARRYYDLPVVPAAGQPRARGGSPRRGKISGMTNAVISLIREPSSVRT